MTDQEENQRNLDILNILDRLIEEGPWDDTLLLRAIGQKLNDYRARYYSYLEQSGAIAPTTTELAALSESISEHSGQLKVFVALYNADGTNLSKWEAILANLPKTIISRPAYSNESEVRAYVKSKENPQNEAYIDVYVVKTALLKQDPRHQLFDKLRHSLLQIKQGGIDLNQITRFVHVSGQYQYRKGKLIREQNSPQSIEFTD